MREVVYSGDGMDIILAWISSSSNIVFLVHSITMYIEIPAFKPLGLFVSFYRQAGFCSTLVMILVFLLLL